MPSGNLDRLPLSIGMPSAGRLSTLRCVTTPRRSRTVTSAANYVITLATRARSTTWRRRCWHSSTKGNMSTSPDDDLERAIEAYERDEREKAEREADDD
jgi:hypothetical protein